MPIVPVALRGIYEIWPRTQGIAWRRLWPWSRNRVRIAFGPPLTVAEGESYAAAATRLRDTVDAMWQRL